MSSTWLQGASVLVLGLGDSGLAMARWCAHLGADVSVWDSREQPPQAAALRGAVPTARLMSGPLTDVMFAGVKLVLKSPGLAPSDERIAGPMNRAADSGVRVLGEVELFARALADLKVERGYAPKVVAITGTNGKTTTTSMAALLIERAGKRVGMAGNIGPTILGTLLDALLQEPSPSTSEEVSLSREGERVGGVAGLSSGLPGAGVAGRACKPDCALQVRVSREETFVLGSQDETVVPRGDPHPSPLPQAGEGTPPSGLGQAGDGTPPSGSTQAGVDAEQGVDLAAIVTHIESAEALSDLMPLSEESDVALTLAPPPPPAPTFEHLPEVWVLELSSFQLDGVTGFEPDAAVVLNLTQDHLDWHGDMTAYIAAKARIYGQHATMVINRDDARVERLVPAPVVVKGASKGRNAKPIARRVVRFGTDAPSRPGDYGIVVEGGMAWLVRALEADETIKLKRGAVDDEPLHLQRLMPADALRVRGRHNASNALAALALATSIGCPLAPMLHGLRDYAGEPHRVEWIATLDEVDAFDDSKGTNVGATVAALDGLGADKAPAKLVVILGGDGKGQDFAPLARPVTRHARAVATLGRDAEAIEAVLAPTGVPFLRHATLEDATRWAFAQAQAGDAVLLSPACASLDMFRNYGHRAEVFIATVHELVAERGGIA